MCKRFIIFFCFVFSCCGFTTVSYAGFPEKPITITVPFNPGGSSDLSARVMAKYISKYLDNPVVVANKPGGGGFSETSRILKQRNMHDGYMLMLLGPINAYPEIFQRSYPYEYKDFKAVGNVTLSIGCIAVAKDAPYKTMKDFVAAAKIAPQPIKYSRAATGGTSHIIPVLFADTYKLSLEEVPYGGDSKAATALLRGEVKVCSANPAALIPHHKNGSIRILSILSPTRLPEIPDVPTFQETGYALPLTALGPLSIFAPAGAPDEAVIKLREAMVKASKDDEFVKDMHKVGLMPYVVVGNEFDNYINEFANIVGPIIKRLELYK